MLKESKPTCLYIKKMQISDLNKLEGKQLSASCQDHEMQTLFQDSVKACSSYIKGMPPGFQYANYDSFCYPSFLEILPTEAVLMYKCLAE